jgi:hypothetical protein
MSGEVRTQGTEVFLIDTVNSPQSVKKIVNVMDVGEFGPQAGDIDVTNFDSTAKEYLTGLPDNGEATLQLNYKPNDSVHQFLQSQAGNGVRFQFAICLADGTSPPTLTGNTPTLPNNRTSALFTASVKQFRTGIKKDDAVRSPLSLRISGGITWKYHS